MSDEEIDVLYNEILKLPKVERPVTATTMCELNVNDLFDIIREFRKIPEYSDLLNENKKLKHQLQQKENIIKEVREYTSKTQMPEGYKKMILETLDFGKFDVVEYKEYQKLENIIKEAREKIKESCWDYEYETYSNMTSDEVKELAGILDKGE